MLLLLLILFSQCISIVSALVQDLQDLKGSATFLSNPAVTERSSSLDPSFYHLQKDLMSTRLEAKEQHIRQLEHQLQALKQMIADKEREVKVSTFTLCLVVHTHTHTHTHTSLLSFSYTYCPSASTSTRTNADQHIYRSVIYAKSTYTKYNTMYSTYRYLCTLPCVCMHAQCSIMCVYDILGMFLMVYLKSCLSDILLSSNLLQVIMILITLLSKCYTL